MGTVRRLAAAAGDVTLGQVADAYLATLRGAEQASTRRTYGRVVHRPVGAPGTVDVERLAGRRPVRRGVLAAAGLARRRPVANARAPQAAAGSLPGPVPGRGRAAAHPRGHRPARAHPVADAVRDRRPVGRAPRARRRGPGLAQP